MDFGFVLHCPIKLYLAINSNTTEIEKFTQEVTVLRNLGILEEFRTNASALNYVRKQKSKGKNISKKDVLRFKVKTP
jgi:hypothetical protein